MKNYVESLEDILEVYSRCAEADIKRMIRMETTIEGIIPITKMENQIKILHDVSKFIKERK